MDTLIAVLTTLEIKPEEKPSSFYSISENNNAIFPQKKTSPQKVPLDLYKRCFPNYPETQKKQFWWPWKKNCPKPANHFSNNKCSSKNVTMDT